MSGPTPMMRQYQRIKQEHPEAILLFHLGDFYEMFFDDARDASRILNITLTSRDRQKADPIPLCGIPVHCGRELHHPAAQGRPQGGSLRSGRVRRGCRRPRASRSHPGHHPRHRSRRTDARGPRDELPGRARPGKDGDRSRGARFLDGRIPAARNGDRKPPRTRRPTRGVRARRVAAAAERRAGAGKDDRAGASRRHGDAPRRSFLVRSLRRAPHAARTLRRRDPRRLRASGVRGGGDGGRCPGALSPEHPAPAARQYHAARAVALRGSPGARRRNPAQPRVARESRGRPPRAQPALGARPHPDAPRLAAAARVDRLAPDGPGGDRGAAGCRRATRRGGRSAPTAASRPRRDPRPGAAGQPDRPEHRGPARSCRSSLLPAAAPRAFRRSGGRPGGRARTTRGRGQSGRSVRRGRPHARREPAAAAQPGRRRPGRRQRRTRRTAPALARRPDGTRRARAA